MESFYKCQPCNNLETENMHDGWATGGMGEIIDKWGSVGMP